MHVLIRQLYMYYNYMLALALLSVYLAASYSVLWLALLYTLEVRLIWKALIQWQENCFKYNCRDIIYILCVWCLSIQPIERVLLMSA